MNMESKPLIICPGCESLLIYPVAIERHPDGTRIVIERCCPECEHNDSVDLRRGRGRAVEAPRAADPSADGALRARDGTRGHPRRSDLRLSIAPPPLRRP